MTNLCAHPPRRSVCDRIVTRDVRADEPREHYIATASTSVTALSLLGVAGVGRVPLHGRIGRPGTEQLVARGALAVAPRGSPAQADHSDEGRARDAEGGDPASRLAGSRQYQRAGLRDPVACHGSVGQGRG